MDAQLDKKNATWIANLLFNGIKKVGSKRVVQICMDNASVNRAATVEVNRKYPHIICTNCSAHCLNMLIKDICTLRPFLDTLAKINTIVVFMHRPSIVRRVFETQFSKLQLLRPGTTWFGTQVIMLEQYLTLADKLRQFVNSQAWENLNLDAKEGGQEVFQYCNSRTLVAQGREILSILSPAYEVLRYVDTRTYTSGQMYGDMLLMKGKIKMACADLKHMLY